MVAIALLGPVSVTNDDGGEIKLGGVKRQAILAHLALHVGHEVAVSTLVDEVWGDEAPDTVVNTLQVNVSSLRRALAAGGVGIDRTTGGYRLNAPMVTIDVHRFEGLVAEGRAALRGQRPESALELLTRALAMWNGRPFDGLDTVPFIERVRPALERTRTTAAIDQLECLLRLGRFDDATVGSEVFVAMEPFDERGWGILMTAHYWAGRPSDALKAFQCVRRTLADELGLEPGPELLSIERGVLEHTLRAPHAPPNTDDGSSRPVVLPAARTLVGRAAIVEQVTAMLGSDGFVSLIGLGGIGKTSVAVSVAHRLANEGTDVHFVDLSPVTDSVAAAEAVMRTVGFEAGGEALATVATWAGQANALLVLDNLEQIADPVPLMTALRERSRRLRLLITSRRAVRVRGEHIVVVPPLPVRRDPEEGAAALFALRAGQVRSDLADLDLDTVTEICELTAGIPLAVELVALQLRVLSPDQLLLRLRRFTEAALDFDATTDYPERQQSLRAVLEATTSMLPEHSARVLLRCAVVGGPVSIDLVESMTASDGLDGLADVVESGLANRVAGADAVTIPDPVRQHVVHAADRTERTEATDDLIAATRSMLAAAGVGWHGPFADHHRRRLTLDAAAIDTTVAVLLERHDWDGAADVSFLLAPYWLQQSRFNDALATLDVLDHDALPPELALRVRLLRGTFASYVSRGDTVELLEPALAALPAAALPDRLVVNAWCCVGAFHAHHHADDDVRRCVIAARETAARSGEDALVALARDFEGYAASYLGDTDTAIALTLDAIVDARKQGDRHALALLLANAAEAMLQADRVEEARALADEAFDLARSVDLGVASGWVLLMHGATALAADQAAAAWGPLVEHLRFVTERHPDPLIVGDSLGLLAAAQSRLHEPEAAARTWGAALTLHRDQGVDPDRRRLRIVQTHWDATRNSLGADRFDALVLAGTTSAERVIESLLRRADGDAEPSPTSPPRCSV